MDPGTDPRPALGRLAEELACDLLRRRGARIVARNVEVAGGELDILCVVDGERTAVEVRSRRGAEPLEAFDAAKEDQVWRLARRLRPPATRVDLIAVRFRADRVDLRWVPRVG